MWSTRWIAENAGCPTLGRLHNGSLIMAKQHQYSVRTGDDNNGFFVHAAHHHGVGGEEERGTRVELFKWDEAQLLIQIATGREVKSSRNPFTSMPTRPSRELA